MTSSAKSIGSTATRTAAIGSPTRSTSPSSALEGLQRKGQVIGFRMNHDERYYYSMSKNQAQQWVRDKTNTSWTERIRAKMRAIGITGHQGHPL